MQHKVVFIPVWVHCLMAVRLGPAVSIIKPSTLLTGNTAEKCGWSSQWWELSKPSGRGLVWALWNREWFPSPQGNLWKKTYEHISSQQRAEKTLKDYPVSFLYWWRGVVMYILLKKVEDMGAGSLRLTLVRIRRWEYGTNSSCSCEFACIFM